MDSPKLNGYRRLRVGEKRRDGDLIGFRYNFQSWKRVPTAESPVRAKGRKRGLLPRLESI